MTDAAHWQVLERTPESSEMYSRVFPARPDQVGKARAFLGRVLAGWPLIDEALVVCSELVTNALLHSASARPGGQLTVCAIVREYDYLWIEVRDQGGQWVHGRSSELSGRGLEIVAALADYWDVRGDDTGRVVCARFDWPVPVHDDA